MFAIFNINISISLVTQYYLRYAKISPQAIQILYRNFMCFNETHFSHTTRPEGIMQCCCICSKLKSGYRGSVTRPTHPITHIKNACRDVLYYKYAKFANIDLF